MQAVDIQLDQSIKWPDACAYCMGPSHRQVESRYSVISGINPMFYTRKFISIKHPVCKKHRYAGRFYAFFSHQSFVDLFVGLLFVPILFFLPVMVMSLVPGQYETPLFGVFCLTYIAAVITLGIRAPVKLIKPKGNAAAIRFRNEAYAKAFRQLNKQG